MPWHPEVGRGSVPGVDIGPIRQRLTAEPISSPVPGEQSWETSGPEPVTDERAAAAGVPDIVPTTRTAGEPAR